MTTTQTLTTPDLLHRLEGLHTERNSLAGRFTYRSQIGPMLIERPELRARLVRLTEEISALEMEYAARLSYHSIEGGYTCPRCGSRIPANDGGVSWAFVEMSGPIGCCEDCMSEMLADPDKRVAAALAAWKAA